MLLIYLTFLLSLVILIVDFKSTPADKKLTSWNKGRIKMVLGCWTMLLGSSVAIIVHIAHAF